MSALSVFRVLIRLYRYVRSTEAIPILIRYSKELIQLIDTYTNTKTDVFNNKQLNYFI